MTGVQTCALPISDGSWLIDGKLQIDDLKEVLKIPKLPEEESGRYQTLGGLVMLQVGRVPVTGDVFEAEGHRFEVVDMDGKRVDKVLVSKLTTDQATERR